jgi:hypothetical protein
MKTRIYPTILLTLCHSGLTEASTPQIQSSIDTRTGAYVLKWTAQGLPLNWNYNSRDVRVGLFGAGWCTTLDQSLETTQNGDFVYHDCTSSGQRFVRRLKFGLGLRWQKAGDTTDWIEKKADHFYHKKIDGTFESYNLYGSLLETSRGEQKIMIERDSSDIIVSITFNTGPPIKVRQSNRKIGELLLSAREKWKFTYENNNLQLVESKNLNSSEVLFSATYDELHNLSQFEQLAPRTGRNPANSTSPIYPLRHLQEKVTYDMATDRVLFIDAGPQCHIQVDYDQMDQGSSSLLTTTVRRRCSEKPSLSRFEYLYQHGSGATQILKAARIISAKTNNTYYFESDTGLATNRKPKLVFQSAQQP